MSVQDIEEFFHPRSVAIAGASSNPKNLAVLAFLKPLLHFGFKGKIFPINPKGGEAFGFKIYPNLLDIPEPVDHVIVGISSTSAPQLMKECVAKGVKLVTCFAAGFGELDEEGKKLEAQVVEIAHHGGVRILGPNCMGIYCPKAGLSFAFDFPKEAGNVGFIAQSGGNSYTVVRAAAERGIRFSKVISYGNACDLNECDLLEYLTFDTETEIIVAYIEGIKEGRRFLKVVKEATKIKPVILLKGGMSKAGSRAASSHTASLAGEKRIWGGFSKQTGAIEVSSLDELVDMVSLFTCSSPIRGRKIGIVGIGGGASVLAADVCENSGFLVPALPQELIEELREFTPEIGNIFRNPIDSQYLIWDPKQFVETTLRFISKWEEIDFLIFQFSFDLFYSEFYESTKTAEVLDAFIHTAKNLDKPVVLVYYTVTNRGYNAFVEAKRQAAGTGVPIFPSIERAVKALDKFIDYQNTHT